MSGQTWQQWRVAPCGMAALLALGGCGTMQSVQINPTRMHMAEGSAFAQWAKANSTAVPASEVSTAEALPAQRYFATMKTALQWQPGQDKAPLSAYAEAGIAVTQAHCLRWFQRMSDQGLVKDFADGNLNVLRQLGTALLGVGGAADAVVTVYGAANTAYEGLSKNYEDTFLLAPTSRKVKQQIMGLLDSEANKLLNPGDMRGFDDLYVRLERYADLCTHATAREIVNSALDQGKAEIDPEGKVLMNPSKAKTDLAASQAREAADRAQRSVQEQLSQERDTTSNLRRQLTQVQSQLDQALQAYKGALAAAAAKSASSPE